MIDGSLQRTHVFLTLSDPIELADMGARLRLGSPCLAGSCSVLRSTTNPYLLHILYYTLLFSDRQVRTRQSRWDTYILYRRVFRRSETFQSWIYTRRDSIKPDATFHCLPAYEDACYRFD